MVQPFTCHDEAHQQCVNLALQRAEDLCVENKLRLTPLRRRILEMIWQSHQPVGAYDLLDLLQREGRAAPPTVYRTLDFLLEHGLVHRLASRTAYFGCSHPGQKHSGQVLICESCNVLAELDNRDIRQEIDSTAASIGFQVREQLVEISGLCPKCRQGGADV
ncbi:MAG TPA: Fur family transcriptional regulator [Geopsychrobacteraceae bacterium]|nr:Fur family transcriptional regulator [Geopsychrobacteraceae bacterium]